MHEAAVVAEATRAARAAEDRLVAGTEKQKRGELASCWLAARGARLVDTHQVDRPRVAARVESDDLARHSAELIREALRLQVEVDLGLVCSDRRATVSAPPGHKLLQARHSSPSTNGPQ